MYQRPEIVSNMPRLNIIIIGLYKYHTTTPRPLVLEDPPDHTTDKYIPNIGTQDEYSTSNGSIIHSFDIIYFTSFLALF